MNFSLSNHLVRLSKVGEILDIVRLEPLSGQACLSFVVDIPEQDIYLLANDILIRLQRFSTEMFHQTFLESEFDNNQEEMLANWFFPNQNDMFESIRLIIQFASDIFSKEKRVVEVPNFSSKFLVFLFWLCSHRSVRLVMSTAIYTEISKILFNILIFSGGVLHFSIVVDIFSLETTWTEVNGVSK